MRQPRKPRTPLNAEELFDFAVKSLGARACSAGDLRTKLTRRAAHRPDVDSAISRLLEVGYLDDARFAESFAHARAANDGFGRTRILADLRARRIPDQLASQAVETALTGTTEEEQIQAFIERRIRGPIDDEKKLAAAFRKLRRAGFRTGPALKALKNLSTNPELTADLSEDEPAEDDQAADEAQN